MRAMFISFFSSIYNELPESLYRNGRIVPVCWFVSGVKNHHNLQFETIQNYFPDCSIYSIVDARDGVYIESSLSLVPSKEMIDKLLEYKAESIAIIDRLSVVRSKRYIESIELYHRLVGLCEYILNKTSPDVLFFSVEPHGSFEYILFRVAQVLKIQVRIIRYTRILSRGFIVDDIFKYPKVELKMNEKEISQDVLDYINKFILSNSDVTTEDMQEIESKLRFSHFENLKNLLISITKKINSDRKLSKFNQKMYDEKIFRFSIVFDTLKWMLNKLYWLKEFEKYSASNADLDSDFIYVPLAMQPEATTLPLGGHYYDQILMIRVLSSNLPQNWKIYVKEHPAQITLDFIELGRYEGFYRKLTEIPNVVFLSNNYSSFQLQRKCRMLATVNGTAGLEAAVRGKPVLIFGDSWYKDFPGVYSLKSHSDCREIIYRIINGSVETASQNDILSYFSQFDDKTYRVILPDPNFAKWGGVSMDEFSESLTKCIDL